MHRLIKTAIKIIKNPLFLFDKIRFLNKTIDTSFFLKKNFDGNKNIKKTKTFKAYYDLNFNSISYNFIPFLLLAENFCYDNKYEGYELVIVPQRLPETLKYHDFVNQYGEDSINFRIYNLFPGICHLAKNCKGLNILPSRNNLEKIINLQDSFPIGYGVDYDGVKSGYDHSLHYYLKKHGIRRELTPTKHSENIINRLTLGKKKIVTFTIRNSKFDKSRNTNLKDFIKFSKELEKEYEIVFIPDTDQPFDDKIENFEYSQLGTMASYNPAIRLALYQKSHLNILSDNGPLLLACYSKKIKYISFWNSENSVIYSEENQKDNYKHTFNEEHQFYWANNRQIIFPGIDNYENLKKAYKRFLEVGIN